MKFIITGKKLNLTEPLKNTVEKKISKLDRYFHDDASATVILSTEKLRDIIEVTINFNGMIYRAQEITDDMYTSIDKVIDTLERQIRKNKTRLEKRLRAGAFIEPSAYFTDEAEDEFELIKTKRFTLKPMSVDEAILQMNMLSHTFFVFLNADTESTCVVYKRKDGGYGLIEPEL